MYSTHVCAHVFVRVCVWKLESAYVYARPGWPAWLVQTGAHGSEGACGHQCSPDKKTTT